MITDPAGNDAFTALLMSDLAEPAAEVDKSSSGPDNTGEVETLSTDAGPDEEAEDADDSSPDDAGELETTDEPDAPGEPVEEGDRFKDGSGKTEAGKAHREAERELGRKSNEIATLRSRLEQREAELASLNRQLQQDRLKALSSGTPEAYEALEAEAQRAGLPPEEYLADQRLDLKLQERFAAFDRSNAYTAAQTFASTLPEMDKIGGRVAELLEESGALDAVPSHLPASEQARQMKQAIQLAHLQAHNEHLQKELPRVRKAAEQHAAKQAAAKRAAKQASSSAGSSAAVPSPGATPERSPADALFGGPSGWWQNVKR